MLITTINSSIVLIALPDIFRGIHLDPLLPGNTSYLLWMMMGFMVATAVLVVTFGRIGDMFGRVRMFNLGLAVFTVCSILLSVTWMTGSSAALWLIAMRIGQGVGGALVMGNSSAILTDAFPSQERGLALGVNAVAAIAGSFIGLVLGGLLAPASWRLVFLVSRALRHLRHRLGVLEAAGARRAPAGAHRLVGKRDVRGRADPRARLDHVRHPALRRAFHGLDEPARARRDGHAGWCCSRSSSSSSFASRIRCSASGCSASGPSPPAASPRCWRRSAAAG